MGSHTKIGTTFCGKHVCVGDVQYPNWPQRGHDRSSKGTEGEECVLI